MGGKSRAYLEYKDSGVEWVGSIPVEWKTSRFKHRVALVTDKATTKINPVGLENIKGWTGEFVSSDAEFQGDGVAFQSGDILFGKLRPYLAKIFLANDEGEAVGDFHVFRPNNFEGCFLQYLMLTEEYISIVDGATYGAKMPRASWDFMSNMRIPCPSKCEQTQIANFLDHETAKIDTLIDKQQQLIELLKDSGVEWLGEVPEHWVVRRLKHAAKLQSGIPKGRDITGKSSIEVPMLRVACSI